MITIAHGRIRQSVGGSFEEFSTENRLCFSV